VLNAIEMDFTNIDEGGYDIDELVTPSMDLSNVDNATVTFKYAYATQSTDLVGITDVFEVYISNNCGQSWSATPRVSLEGYDLVTAGSVSIPFVPGGAADWREESFDVPSTYLRSGFRMMFYFRAGEYPNNLYIDDINMTGTVSIAEQDADFYGATVYPNPANETVWIDANDQKITSLEIYNLQGQLVWKTSEAAAQVAVSLTDFSSGTYLVKAQIGAIVETKKLTVIK
jgi:hypothetical protein